METLQLTAAETEPSTPDYQIDSLTLDWAAARIRVELRCVATGKRKAFDYVGATAITMMKALNTANFSTQSLHARVLSRLVTDGTLSGIVIGSTD
mgnify:FL=1